jgi:hypothetical protein
VWRRRSERLPTGVPAEKKGRVRFRDMENSQEKIVPGLCLSKEGRAVLFCLCRHAMMSHGCHRLR